MGEFTHALTVAFALFGVVVLSIVFIGTLKAILPDFYAGMGSMVVSMVGMWVMHLMWKGPGDADTC